MRTIGRRWPRSTAPRGDYPELCGYCGVKWRRSQLTKTPWGLLACPDDVGDSRYAKAPHVENNEGTGSSIRPDSEQSDPLPVFL